MNRPWLDAPANQLEILWRLESSEAGGGMSRLRGVPGVLARAGVRNRARRRFSAGVNNEAEPPGTFLIPVKPSVNVFYSSFQFLLRFLARVPGCCKE
jgi:hypothetical protein